MDDEEKSKQCFLKVRADFAASLFDISTLLTSSLYTLLYFIRIRTYISRIENILRWLSLGDEILCLADAATVLQLQTTTTTTTKTTRRACVFTSRLTQISLSHIWSFDCPRLGHYCCLFTSKITILCCWLLLLLTPTFNVCERVY